MYSLKSEKKNFKAVNGIKYEKSFQFLNYTFSFFSEVVDANLREE